MCQLDTYVCTQRQQPPVWVMDLGTLSISKLDYIMFSTEQNHFIWLLYRITYLRSFSIIFYLWGKPVIGPNPKVGSSASEIVREWVVSPRKIIWWSPNP